MYSTQINHIKIALRPLKCFSKTIQKVVIKKKLLKNLKKYMEKDKEQQNSNYDYKATEEARLRAGAIRIAKYIRYSELLMEKAKEKKRPLMYSDLMSRITQRLASKNLLTKEQTTNVQPIKQDNTIEITFLKRSKNSDQK